MNNIVVTGGKTFRYVSSSPEVFSEQLAGAGVPAAMIQVAAAFDAAIALGEFDHPDTTLTNLIGREPASPQQVPAQLYPL